MYLRQKLSPLGLMLYTDLEGKNVRRLGRGFHDNSLVKGNITDNQIIRISSHRSNFIHMELLKMEARGYKRILWDKIETFRVY